MAKRPAQGKNEYRAPARRKVAAQKVRTNAAPRTSNNKRKRLFG